MNAWGCVLYDHTDILKKIEKDLPEQVQILAIAILDYLIETPRKDVTSLSYGALKNIVQKRVNFEPKDKPFISATHYFVGDRVHLLDPQFHYFDDETNQYYPLSVQEFAHAQNSGILKHPLTDDPVTDYENFIILSYAASQFVENISK